MTYVNFKTKLTKNVNTFCKKPQKPKPIQKQTKIGVLNKKRRKIILIDLLNNNLQEELYKTEIENN